MSEERLDKLEFKIAHQDVLLEELNQVIIKQQETIDRLEAGIKLISKQLSDAGKPEVGPGNQKPPHY
jgi:SlyX protein